MWRRDKSGIRRFHGLSCCSEWVIVWLYSGRHRPIRLYGRRTPLLPLTDTYRRCGHSLMTFNRLVAMVRAKLHLGNVWFQRSAPSFLDLGCGNYVGVHVSGVNLSPILGPHESVA